MEKIKAKFNIDLENRTLALEGEEPLKLDGTARSTDLSSADENGDRVLIFEYGSEICEQEMDNIDAYLRARGIDNDEQLNISGRDYNAAEASAVFLIGDIQTNLGEGNYCFK